MNKIIKKTINEKYKKLYKFGGSSLADENSYRIVASIILKRCKPDDLIVVSASGKTTEYLINWQKSSRENLFLAKSIQNKIFYHQKKLIFKLLSKERANIIKKAFLNDFFYLDKLLNKKKNNYIISEIIGYGEIWSARLLSSFLKEVGLSSSWIDARLFLKVIKSSAQPVINKRHSSELLKEILDKNAGKYLVVTGFIASNKKGKTVLLGRNGSDYSATQIAALAKVKNVTIWSDVCGIYTADPKLVEKAQLIPLLSFKEAHEFARLTNSVLHARTLEPVFFTNINLFLRCTFSPRKGFTKIERFLDLEKNIKIITNQDNVCLIDLIIKEKKYYENIILFLKRKKLEPLTVSLNLNKNLIKLCYSFELGKYVKKILKKKIRKINLIVLRDGFSLIALIGSGLFNCSFYLNFFYQQLGNELIEFISCSKRKNSLIVVLNKSKTVSLINKLHKKLFNKI